MGSPRSCIPILGLLLWTGCNTPGGALSAKIAGRDFGVAFGQSIEEVQSVRKALEFRPYSGWIEELGNDPLFLHAIFRFGLRPPNDRPRLGEALSAVSLVGRSPADNTAILEALDGSYGHHELAGCALISEVNREEDMVLLWPDAPGVVVAQIIVRQSDNAVLDSSRVIVTMADVGTPVEALEAFPLSGVCRFAEK